jgi:hypothetical protein
LSQALSHHDSALRVLDMHVQEGKFQRSLALVAGFSGLLGGLEVTLEHYKGSYGQRIMYSPVILSTALLGAGVAGAIRPKVARTLLPAASIALLADGLIGFGFHIRGIARKPGGWRLPVFNIVMGPPIFAPLLLGVGGYLGLIASMLRPEETPPSRLTNENLLPAQSFPLRVREGKFQRNMCVAFTVSAALNGFESLYSHYKSDFSTRAQWIPIVLTPPMLAAGMGAIYSPKIARTALPVVSMAALLAGGVGFFYHVRGTLRRPGGMKTPFYNLVYGPPVFAPLLFAATGFMGLLASRLRRES